VQPDQNKGDVSLEKARQLLSSGAYQESLSLVKAYWLKHPDDPDAISLLSELMKEGGRSELSQRLEKLLGRLPAKTSYENMAGAGPQELFEAGFALIDARQHELAAMLLKRCATLIPEEPVVNYELGYALMSLRRFDKAIPYFTTAAAKEPDFDTLLNLAACYTMTRQLQAAQATIAAIAKLDLDNEQSSELEHRKVVLRRLNSVPEMEELSVRDWMFILYGAVLLRQGKRDEISKEDAITIGTTLALLKGLLDGLGVEPEVIEFYGPQSRPMARAIAELLEIPFDSYKGPTRPEKALLTMTWASDIIGPHKSFTQSDERRAIFSYALTWDEPLPIVPEIVGCLAHEEPVAWQPSTSTSASADGSTVFDQEEFDNKAEASYKSMLYHARDLESEPSIIQSIQEMLDYYSDKTSLLMLGSASTISSRSEYTAELD